MGKGLLIGSLAVCFLAVGLLAVLTPTVIVNGGEHGGRILHADGSLPGSGPGAFGPGPGHGGSLPVRPGEGQFPGLGRMRECLQRNGGSMPDLMRMRACMGLPAPR